jgi:hypothetical protein
MVQLRVQIDAITLGPAAPLNIFFLFPATILAIFKSDYNSCLAIDFQWVMNTRRHVPIHCLQLRLQLCQ